MSVISSGNCIFNYNYNNITVFNQECKNIFTKKTSYSTIRATFKKSVLESIRRRLFTDVLNMFKNGATLEQVWQYVDEEINRVYKLRKIRKVIKSIKEVLISAIRSVNLNPNRGTTKEYRSISRKRTTTASAKNCGDSGDSDPDQPGEPPSHTCTSAHPHLIPPSTPQKNRFIYSRRLASCQWLMAQGVA